LQKVLSVDQNSCPAYNLQNLPKMFAQTFLIYRILSKDLLQLEQLEFDTSILTVKKIKFSVSIMYLGKIFSFFFNFFNILG